MQVASLELCRELYELSGWGEARSTDRFWTFNSDDATIDSGIEYVLDDPSLEFEQSLVYPAYDLSYLLQKLPAKHQMVEGDVVELTIRKEDNVVPRGIRYLAYYAAGEDSDCWCQVADTPEDAAASLAIKLFEQNILSKGESDL